MTEVFLNAVWALIAAGAVVKVVVHRRDAKTLLAVAAVLALLFPIISATDDLTSAIGAQDDTALFAILATFILTISLTAVARLFIAQPRLSSCFLPPHTDPRSPPRV